VYQRTGQLQEAERLYRQFLQVEPSQGVVWQLLGTTCQAQGKLQEAVSCYEEALRRGAEDVAVHNNLGAAYNALGRNSDAIASYQAALRVQPGCAAVYRNLGVSLADEGNWEAALASFREAIRLQPDFAEAFFSQGMLLGRIGDVEPAVASLREVLRLNPRYAEAYTHLVSLLGRRLPESDLRALRHLATDTHLSAFDLSRVHFALAQAYDARSEYSLSATHAREANALDKTVQQGRGQVFDPAAHAKVVDRIITTFTPEFFARVRGWGVGSELPVFVFGLARSGTTLIEQILASHSRVKGAEELLLGAKAFDSVRKIAPSDEEAIGALGRLGPDEVRQGALRLLGLLPMIDRTILRVIDKGPMNYLHLGLLATMFPRARFIHCQRDLRDVAVSWWLTNFIVFRGANDMEAIASSFREYRRVMAHWRQVLPASILDVSYENVVADLEGETRRLLAGCGLEWDPACLSFHETRRLVRTASQNQVRQPIYSRSVGRWRNYAEPLAPLFARLEALGPI
jgi:Tfp pilus assembly protein PilF